MICAWCGNERARCDTRGTCSECGKDRDTQWRDMLEMANAGYVRQVVEANTLRKLLREAVLEIKQFHAQHHPSCGGGCPALEIVESAHVLCGVAPRMS